MQTRVSLLRVLPQVIGWMCSFQKVCFWLKREKQRGCGCQEVAAPARPCACRAVLGDACGGEPPPPIPPLPQGIPATVGKGDWYVGCDL